MENDKCIQQYEAVGGFGIKLEQKDMDTLIKNGIFTEEEWESDWLFCLERLNIPFDWAGDYHYRGGSPRFYVYPEGVSITEMYEGIHDLLETLKSKGVIKSIDDVKIIKDIKIK